MVSLVSHASIEMYNSAHHLWSRRYLALLDLATSLLLQNRFTPRHTRCRLYSS